ncbi:hypothetical protein SM124_07015 [Bacillus sp. 31A1R]|uniref:Spore coat protein n=1 Tax=Robertmurraya mangrovi TaxID=3098077 RepID=A0ABU5IWK5_9BACI|nr:hypothetical protein [Bacillus sp. 31A1R]MDZ5471496.1 hypothetical protein [Bacillus sp. 31A1R]
MGVHETLEVSEVLMFKNLCLTKSTAMSALVQDEELKTILSDDVNKTKTQIERLQEFITDRGSKS